MIIRARRKTDGEPKMTPELTDRIVKVCERIGWPIMDNDDRFMVYYKDNIWADGGVSWIWQQIDTKEMNDCVFNVGSILGTHFRQWLESKYDRVLIEYTSGLPFKWRAECGIDGETTSRVRVAANDYLDLLLTAVEKTLEQEAKP